MQCLTTFVFVDLGQLSEVKLTLEFSMLNCSTHFLQLVGLSIPGTPLWQHPIEKQDINWVHFGWLFSREQLLTHGFLVE